MIYPAGAIRTTKEMWAMIGKPVYLPLPDISALAVPRVGPKIIKFHPKSIFRANVAPHHYYWVETEEAVNAAKMHAISARKDWSISWGADPIFFFSNFWFAYAYAQHADNLRG